MDPLAPGVKHKSDTNGTVSRELLKTKGKDWGLFAQRDAGLGGGSVGALSERGSQGLLRAIRQVRSQPLQSYTYRGILATSSRDDFAKYACTIGSQMRIVAATPVPSSFTT